LNSVTTPLFWLLLAPSIFPNLDYKNPVDLFMGIHMLTLHTVPIISSTINILLTDIILLKQDTKWIFWIGIFYMFANLAGTICNGKPIYPIVDWVNVPQTIFLFVLLALV